MKKWALVLLGLFLAALAATCIFQGDPIVIGVGIALGAGAWRSFRAAGRLAPAQGPGQRPWER